MAPIPPTRKYNEIPRILKSPKVAFLLEGAAFYCDFRIFAKFQNVRILNISNTSVTRRPPMCDNVLRLAHQVLKHIESLRHFTRFKTRPKS